jgi:tetratricopeptide (TPR) repeat protein
MKLGYTEALRLRFLQQYEKAIASYDKAIQIKPDKHELGITEAWR